MEGTDSCKNKLSFTDCLELDFKNNLPTSELMILKELSLEIRDTLKKHNGSILKAFEFGENNYIICISTMIIRMVEIKERMVLVDISDIASFVKNFLNNSNSHLDCLTSTE
ncbi:hypothetical protein [Aliarcobacter skirrowii]|uniref:Uncharacterized protein n=1 Tax=Aliarcobacter skirrowii TaxID=28200 RepID=A0AAW9DAA1_9BACT|nr:hypothetical protein [Aliarcobacter skirrowii]MDX4069136.1 hypothetical protein [Aliarcobacter skirrowii]